MYYRRRGPFGGIAGGIVLIGIALAFLLGRGEFFLPVFFVFLGFSILIGSFASPNPRNVYGAFYGFLWMIVLALFFITGSWIWFLIGAGISAILGALARPSSWITWCRYICSDAAKSAAATAVSAALFALSTTSTKPTEPANVSTISARIPATAAADRNLPGGWPAAQLSTLTI